MPIPRFVQYVRECSEQSKKTAVIGVIVMVFVGIGLIENLLPFLDVDLRVPKIPLPWVLTILLIGLLAVILTGGYRKSLADEEGMEAIGGPQIFIGFEATQWGEPPLVVQNNGGGFAYNVVLKIPADGSVFTSHAVNILRDDKDVVPFQGDKVGRVTPQNLVLAGARYLPVVVSCMDSECRWFEYCFDPPDKRYGAGFRLTSKRCLGKIKQI